MIQRIVEFEPIREIWNKYRLENETVIRYKFYISQVIESKSNGNLSYNFKLNNLVEVQNPSIEKMSSYPKQEPITIAPEDLIKEMKFEVLSNKPQIYELDDKSFLFIYEKMNKVWLTRRNDVYGNPVYHLQANAGINIYKPSL